MFICSLMSFYGLQRSRAIKQGGTHSLTYFFTAVSGDIDFPEFTIVGLVDEEQFMYFDSNMKKVVPKTEWMKQKEGADYWDTQTQLAAGTHHVFRNNIQVAKDRFNHSTGVHTFQLMYGCEWDDQTEETDGFRQESYDGEDFMSLDLQEMRWISPVQQGFITQNKWNNNRAYLEGRKHYFNTVCIEWLKKYVGYKKSSLEKTGFYPKAVTITWMRNGQECHTDVDLGELLPNEDGTFQKTSTITVTPDEWKNKKYSCVVKHQNQTIRKILSEKEIRTNREASVPVGIIVFAVILLIVIGVAGYMVYLKKRVLTLDAESLEM
ncbi:MHC class I antigen [Labeo rohita]|uniref:MHC class I antigen n=1 Tax=Labeo rohita TaxID=84645 RepID=A0A498M2S9_LABRO|nr:MHC class I antigen [Labeo rohita]